MNKIHWNSVRELESLVIVGLDFSLTFRRTERMDIPTLLLVRALGHILPHSNFHREEGEGYS